MLTGNTLVHSLFMLSIKHCVQACSNVTLKDFFSAAWFLMKSLNNAVADKEGSPKGFGQERSFHQFRSRGLEAVNLPIHA